ncbi:hypothetical protein ACHQM5_008004 [Ranunculus cassubicifolius]
MTRNSRAKPFHSLGVSFLSIAHKTYRKVEQNLPLPAPIISITKTLARLASPIVYSLEYQWLRSLSFTDMQILAMESLVEFIVPSSSHVFDTVDDLVYLAVSLVAKCENVVDEFPDVMYQLPHSVFNMLYSKGVIREDKGFMSSFDCHGVADDTMLLHSEEKVPVVDSVESDAVENHSSEKDSNDVAVLVEGGKPEKKDPILELFAEGWYMR